MDTTCRLWYNQGPAEFYAGGPGPRSPTYKGFKGEEYAMSAIKVIKRDGTIVDYDRSKIKLAIQKANADIRRDLPGYRQCHFTPYICCQALLHIEI